MSIAKTLAALSGQGNVVVVRRPFVDITGSVEGAMLLDQCLYWHERTTDDNKWFWKTDAEWMDELPLTRYSIRKAREGLVELGLLSVDIRQRRRAPTTYYRVRESVLDTLIREYIGAARLERTRRPGADSIECVSSENGVLAPLSESGQSGLAGRGGAQPQSADVTQLSETAQSHDGRATPLSESEQAIVRIQTGHCLNPDKPIKRKQSLQAEPTDNRQPDGCRDGPTKPTAKKSAAAQDDIRAMVAALEETRGYPIGNFARHVRDAKSLLQAGRTPDDVRTIVRHVLREHREFFVLRRNPLTMTTVIKYASVVLEGRSAPIDADAW